MRSLLKYCKTVLTLLLCVCLLSAVCVPALAADVPAASATEILGEYGELFGGVLDSVREWSAGDGAQFTDELRGMLEQYDLDTLGDDLKTVLDSAAAMSDEELAAAISGLAEQHGVKLLDSQIEQLCQLCRGLEKFSGEELEEKLEEVKENAEELKEGAEELNEKRKKVSGFFQKLRDAATKVVTAIRGFFQKLKKQK